MRTFDAARFDLRAPKQGDSWVFPRRAHLSTGVLVREVSRLSRTDKDCGHLLEGCRSFDTLLGDADQVHDLGLTNDRLVLGSKGR